MATAIPPNRVLTSRHDAELAQEVLTKLGEPDGYLSVGSSRVEAQNVPAEVRRLIEHVLHSVAAGATVTISAVPAELTTSAAASLLGVSRPTLMKLIHGGQLATHKVGAHHRLLASDLHDFLLRRQRRERATFDELRDLLED
ncbi:MAG: helix-turn-helix domain-containing protein [Tetrasphaera sp.]